MSRKNRGHDGCSYGGRWMLLILVAALVCMWNIGDVYYVESNRYTDPVSAQATVNNNNVNANFSNCNNTKIEDEIVSKMGYSDLDNMDIPKLDICKTIVDQFNGNMTEITLTNVDLSPISPTIDGQTANE